MVVAFGQDRKAMLSKPTGESSEVLAAIAEVPQDTTGVETTFTTVAEIVNKWGHYKGNLNHPYRTMVIVVTDEKGDDESHLEEAIASAQRAKVPVYVLGSQAVFGRKENYVTYVDPKTKQVYNGLEVRQGPESILLEQIRLPFWYDGDQYNVLESGFGPYALSRLATATGGIYFVTRFDTRRMGFDPARMREYRPDWVPREQYEKQIAHSPLRQAVLNAALITQRQRLPGMPGLYFPPADALRSSRTPWPPTRPSPSGPLTPWMRPSARSPPSPSSATCRYLPPMAGPLRPDPQAAPGHEGPLLRVQHGLRTHEERRTQVHQTPGPYAWRLYVPELEGHSVQREGRRRAQGGRGPHSAASVDEHPATPWALLAQREIKDPLGFKWVETYVPAHPPAANNNSAGEPRRRRTNPSRRKFKL